MTDKLYPPVHPGGVLLENFLKPLGISQYRLAQRMGVPARRINEVVHGARRITPDMALRLSRRWRMHDVNCAAHRTPARPARRGTWWTGRGSRGG